MPVITAGRPPAPTCEDAWDEDTEASYADSRASANVAIKRSKSDLDNKSAADKKSHTGSDSGYSSKAGTAENGSTTSMRKGNDLRIDTKPIELERERQPYMYRPEELRSSPTKAKAVKMEKTSKPTSPRFQHPHGICWVCDQYGWHVNLEKELQRPATVAPVHTQKVTKSPAPQKARSKEEGDARPSMSRRSSSTKREGRPFSMYGAPGAFGFPMPIDYGHPMLAANGWQTPPNQPPQYPHYQYAYGHAPPTPMSATYSQAPGFFDAPQMQYSQQPEQYYGTPAFEGFEGYPPHYRALKQSDSSRAPSREPRQRSQTKSKPSAEADKISMPPPPKPEQVRPIIRKAPTEYPSAPSRRYSVFADDTDEEEDQVVQAIVTKSRQPSQSRHPPSAFKTAAGADINGRPRPRKSSSYSTPSGTVHVASSSQREMPRRRTDPLEQKLADAESYVAKTNKRDSKPEGYFTRPKMPGEFESEEYGSRSRKQPEIEFEDYVTRVASQRRPDADEYNPKSNRNTLKEGLTVEALKNLDRNSSSMSDTASVQSRQSSSRDSGTGRTRASTALTSNRTNITMDNGISLSIPNDCGDTPLHIMVGNISLSMNPNRQEEPFRELKRIEERPPSEVSQTSRRSLTSDSFRGDTQSVTRQKQNGYSSKRSSRAASTTRGRSEVPSIDYSLLDESYYLEYGA